MTNKIKQIVIYFRKTLCSTVIYIESVPFVFINALSNNVTKDLSGSISRTRGQLYGALFLFGAAYHISGAKVCQVDANLRDSYQMQMLYTILQQDRTLVSSFILIPDSV